MMSNESVTPAPRKRSNWYLRLIAVLFTGHLLVAGMNAAALAQQIFVGAGDIAGSWAQDEATARLLDSVVAANPSAVVYTTGDNVYQNGTAAEFNTYYQPTWGRHLGRTSPAPGNHDYNTSGAVPYYNYFGANAGPAGRGYYTYNLGLWKIISLNSNVGAGAGSAQYNWLLGELQTNTAACTLAYWHHPVFSSGNVHGNNSLMTPLLQLLYDYGADLVLQGHEHIYERYAPQTPSRQPDPTGIRMFIIGTGGSGLYGIGSVQPNSEVRNTQAHGVLRLTLNPTSYNWQFIPIAGQSFNDSGSMACYAGNHLPPPPPPPPPPPGPTSITLNVADGWDSKNQKTLVLDGKLSEVTSSNNSRIEIEANSFLSLRFAGLTTAGSMLSAKLYLEHHEEASFTANALLLQVGGGALSAPFVAREVRPPLRSGEGSEGVFEWDVTAWARNATLVNDLKLVIHNLDGNGKKVKIDRAYLVVQYGATPAIPATPVNVTLFPTDGWDQKNGKTLLQDGKLFLVNGSDDQRGEIEAGYFVSYQFQGIPPSAAVLATKVYVEHHEEDGISANPLRLEVAGGPLNNPAPILAGNIPATRMGDANEATVEWNVSSVIDSVAEVNALKLKIGNVATNGKKSRQDRVHVEVTYE